MSSILYWPVHAYRYQEEERRYAPQKANKRDRFGINRTRK